MTTLVTGGAAATGNRVLLTATLAHFPDTLRPPTRKIRPIHRPAVDRRSPPGARG
jgi:hypothetical protein